MSDFDQLWKDVYSTPAGREALGLLFAELDVYSEIKGGDPISIGIGLGQRNVAVRLARAIGRVPEEVVKDSVEDLNYMEQMLKTKQGDIY